MFRHDDDEAKVLTESHEVEKEIFVTARHASHDPRDLGPTVQPLGLHGSEVWDGGQAGRADIRQKGIGNDRLTRASKNLALERYLPTDCRHGLSVCGEYENRSGGVRAWRPDRRAPRHWPAEPAYCRPNGPPCLPAIVPLAMAEQRGRADCVEGRARRCLRSGRGPGRRRVWATLRGRVASERSPGRSARPRHRPPFCCHDPSCEAQGAKQRHHRQCGQRRTDLQAPDAAAAATLPTTLPSSRITSRARPAVGSCATGR